MGPDQKPPRIDRALLTTRQACKDAVSWFDATWPGGVTSYEDGLEVLQRGRRLDYMAWVLLHVPELRERAPADLRRKVLGPRHDELIALADETARTEWLTPRSASPEADRDALARLVAEHQARLAALPGGATPDFDDWSLVPLAAAFSEVAPVLGLSWHERHGLGPPPTPWALAWRTASRAAQGGAEPAAPAAAGEPDLAPEAWFEQRLQLIAGVSAQLRPVVRVAHQVCRALDDAAFERCQRSAGERFLEARQGASWRAAAEAMVTPADQQDRADEAAVYAAQTLVGTLRLDLGAEALWLLADVPEASPWEPLLRIWRLGYWPSGAIDGRFVIGSPFPSGTEVHRNG